MTIMMHTHDAKSLRVHALDSGSDPIKMGGSVRSTWLGSYPTPPPRAGDGYRTPQVVKRFEIQSSLQRFVSHFSRAKIFDGLENGA